MLRVGFDVLHGQLFDHVDRRRGSHTLGVQLTLDFADLFLFFRILKLDDPVHVLNLSIEFEKALKSHVGLVKERENQFVILRLIKTRDKFLVLNVLLEQLPSVYIGHLIGLLSFGPL